MKWVALPRHGLARFKNQTTNHGGSMTKEDFIRHR
jgi:hypothetical protein